MEIKLVKHLLTFVEPKDHKIINFSLNVDGCNPTSTGCDAIISINLSFKELKDRLIDSGE